MLPVAAVQIGKQLGILSDAVGAAVILASFFTMLLAPIGFSLLGPRVTSLTHRIGYESFADHDASNHRNLIVKAK
jgi:hypothetical protein